MPSFVYCKTHSKADLRADGMIYYPNRIVQLKVHSHGATKIATKSIFTNRKGMYCFQKRLSVILSRGRGSASGGGLPPEGLEGLPRGVCLQGGLPMWGVCIWGSASKGSGYRCLPRGGGLHPGRESAQPFPSSDI